MVATIIKLLIVIVFLVRFVRRPNLAWGIGLLTVSTAMLLDTILGTFNREDALEQFGFFFYVLAGAIFGGAALWLWAVVRPHLPGGAAPVSVDPSSHQKSQSVPLSTLPNVAPATTTVAATTVAATAVAANTGHPGYDRTAVAQQLEAGSSREDLLDLIFDLGLNEMEITGSEPSLRPTIERLLDAVEEAGKVEDLKLGIERIHNPPTPGSLPRLEKLNGDSPRPVMRYYLLGHYTVEQLTQLSAQVDVTWADLGGRAKRGRVRELLDIVYRRGRVDELLAQMKRLPAD